MYFVKKCFWCKVFKVHAQCNFQNLKLNKLLLKYVEVISLYIAIEIISLNKDFSRSKTLKNI